MRKCAPEYVRVILIKVQLFALPQPSVLYMCILLTFGGDISEQHKYIIRLEFCFFLVKAVDDVGASFGNVPLCEIFGGEREHHKSGTWWPLLKRPPGYTAICGV